MHLSHGFLDMCEILWAMLHNSIVLRHRSQLSIFTNTIDLFHQLVKHFGVRTDVIDRCLERGTRCAGTRQ